jgi:hypothetical protein
MVTRAGEVKAKARQRLEVDGFARPPVMKRTDRRLAYLPETLYAFMLIMVDSAGAGPYALVSFWDRAVSQTHQF